MYESGLKGALIAFVLMMIGGFSMGPCGPSSPIPYVLIFPGLLLADYVGGGLGVIFTQLAFGALVGSLAYKLRHRTE